VTPPPLPEGIAALPKAELHLHLEGSIRPAIACKLAARHGIPLTKDEVIRRYSYTNFLGFLDAFIVLSRAISEKGIYPAVDPLGSTSRVLDHSPADTVAPRGHSSRYYD